ncbi:MAG: ribosomal-protein-alanine N-acetyltransferase [Burkholderiales bacterium 70-64]|nr:MAG: ribosomal-protein-alanine N-acetyltransferase [Burkholderiales bacterium 70-64]
MSALPRPTGAQAWPHEAPLRVRPMRRADLDAVAAIECRVYPHPWTRGNFADSLAAGYDAWVLENAGLAGPELVAYAIVMWIPDEVHLLNLSVSAERQGCGLGRAMLRWLMRDAAGRGARGMMLEVRPSNTPAVALYRSAGFAQIGVRKRYYPAGESGREDALVLFARLHERGLDPAAGGSGR